MKYSRCNINGHNYYKVQITQPDGKRKILYGKSIAELREKETKFREEMKTMPSTCSYTVAEYAALQLELIRPHVKEATFIGYEEKVRLYIAAPPLGKKPIDAVVPDDISRVLASVASKSASTYRGIFMLLRRIFRAAKRSHLIDEDPTDGIPSKGGTPTAAKKPLSDKEVATLLDAIAGLPIETFVLLGLYAGLRREESLALQWDCVVLEKETPYIQVRRAWRIEHNQAFVSETLKTSAAKRDIPIPPILENHLRQLKATTVSDFVIPNRKGEPLSGTQWRNYWNQVKVRSTGERTYTRYANGEKTIHTVSPQLGKKASHNPDVTYSIDFQVTSHQLRHTYISNLVYAGVDPKTIQYLAGHENIKITMDVYARIKYNRPEDIAPRINKAFESMKG